MTSSETLLKNIAIIPARGGSKRLKDKNLRLLNGKPLIEWTVKAALDCQLFDRIIVSTDSDAIAAMALSSGAEVPFLRSTELSGDSASPVDVGLDLLLSLKPETYQTLTWLQPTSPLRNSADILAAHKIYQDKQADCVISVCPCEHNPLWSGQLNAEDNIRDFLNSSALLSRSQDLADYFRLNGAIYIVKVDEFISQRSFYIRGNVSYAYKMPKQRSVDIDTQWDLDLAEFILSREQQ